jgi:hypothetical protein
VPSELGESFARAFAAKDFDRVREVLAPEVDFRGMTPNRIWEESKPDAIVDDVLRKWLEDDEIVRKIESIDTGDVGDRHSVRYRFHVDLPGEVPHVFEQQAYYELTDGRISWLRVMCSGTRPA